MVSAPAPPDPTDRTGRPGPLPPRTAAAPDPPPPREPRRHLGSPAARSRRRPGTRRHRSRYGAAWGPQREEDPSSRRSAPCPRLDVPGAPRSRPLPRLGRGGVARRSVGISLAPAVAPAPGSGVRVSARRAPGDRPAAPRPFRAFPCRCPAAAPSCSPGCCSPRPFPPPRGSGYR